MINIEWKTPNDYSAASSYREETNMSRDESKLLLSRDTMVLLFLRLDKNSIRYIITQIGRACNS